MTGMQRDLRVGTFAVFVTACMLLCVLSPAIINYSEDSYADSSDKFVYYALGDSMVNGFGLADYFLEDGAEYTPNADETGKNCYGFLMDVPMSYPGLLKAYIEDEYGKDVNEDYMLSISGLRSAELRTMLYGPDVFYDDSNIDFNDPDDTQMKQIQDALDSLSNYGYVNPTVLSMADFFQERLKGADLVTYNFHYDFGFTLSDAIVTFVENDDESESVSLPFEKYLGPEQIDDIDRYISSAKQTIVENIPNFELEDSMSKLIDILAEAVVFVVVSYCSNFDANVDWLIKNTDAKIVYIDAYNTFGDKCIGYNGIEIPLGSIYGALIETVNGYVKHVSPYKDDVTIVDIYESPELYATEFLSTVDISVDTKRAAIDGSDIWALDEYKEMPYNQLEEIYDLYDSRGGLTSFFRYVFEIDVFDYSTFTSGNFNDVIDDIDERLVTTFELIKGGATVSSDDGSIVIDGGNAGEMIFLETEVPYIWINFFLFNSNALMSHPSENGHVYLFERIINGIDSTYVPGGSIQYISADFAREMGSTNMRLMDLVDVLGGPESDGLISIDDDCANGFRSKVRDNNVIVVEVDAGNPYFLLTEIMEGVVAERMPGLSVIFGVPFDFTYDRYSGLLSPEVVTYLNQLEEKIRPIVEESLASTDFSGYSDIVVPVIDVVLYAYMGTFISMFEVVDLIKELNEDATILMVGAFNPFSDKYIDVPEFDLELPIGEYMSLFTPIVNGVIREYCDATEDVIYVDVSEMPSRMVDGNMDLSMLISIIADNGNFGDLGSTQDFVKSKVDNLLVNELKAVGGDNDKDESETNWLLIGGGAGAAVVAIAGLAIFFRMRK